VKAIKEFVKTTIVGGIVFLVPLILLILVLKHAMAFAGKIAGPVSAAFPEHKIAGVAVATIIAALVLLLLSFMAGLFARTGVGRDLARWLEDSLLGNLPQYRMAKTMAEGLAHVEDGQNLKPALRNIPTPPNLAFPSTSRITSSPVNDAATAAHTSRRAPRR